jgi:hypothetical protein
MIKQTSEEEKVLNPYNNEFELGPLACSESEFDF